MKQLNKQTGRLGEDLATAELVRKGYEILERNFGNKFGEIDIIAKDGGTYVFTEVKTKTGSELGEPEEMVGRSKLAKIRHMATIYLDGVSQPCRIDVVAIVLTPSGEIVRLTHYQNVY